MSMILLGILGAQAAGGAAGAYDLLETQVLSSSAASVTFTGLGSYSDYKHLQIRMVTRTTGTGSGLDNLYIRFNSDTGSNYAAHRLSGTGTTVVSAAYTSRSDILLQNATSEKGAGDIAAVAIVDILDFSNPSKYTTTRVLSGAVNTAEYEVELHSGVWMNTNAVTGIEIRNRSLSSEIGSRFSLYGVK